MLKIPSFTDALPLTLGEKRPAPNSIKPSEEWDLIRRDVRGALWKNCVGGRLQFIPSPSTLGPRKGPLKTPPALQKALDAVGEAFKPPTGFKLGDYVRYKEEWFADKTINFAVGKVLRVDGRKVWCMWSDDPNTPAYALATELTLCDADSWIPHTPGDPMPCAGDLEVEIKVCSEAPGEKAWRLLPDRADSFDRSICISSQVQILSWKPAL